MHARTHTHTRARAPDTRHPLHTSKALAAVAPNAIADKQLRASVPIRNQTVARNPATYNDDKRQSPDIVTRSQQFVSTPPTSVSVSEYVFYAIHIFSV